MELEQFVDQLIAEKGFDTEDAEVKAQLREDLLERIENRMNALILSNLKPEDLDAFEKVLDIGSDESTQQFIQQHIPDFEEKAAAELLNFRSIYIG